MNIFALYNFEVKYQPQFYLFGDMPEAEELLTLKYIFLNAGSLIQVTYNVMACVTSDGRKEALTFKPDTMKNTVYLQLLL